MSCLRVKFISISLQSFNGLLRRYVVGNSKVPCLASSSWIQPEGRETNIVVYNTSTQRKDPLILPDEYNLRWYVCGPTVYDEPHIGHASCYMRFDILRRILSKVFNINVVYAMNITDIDDKIINKALEAGQSVAEVSKYYESRFHQSLTRLNVLPPTITLRVTENIEHIKEFIQRLIDNKSAYVTSSGNVYFKTSCYETYGCFSRMVSDNVIANEGLTIDEDKKDSKDFALWKASKPGEPKWESAWGEGRPGWHIECSAMASRVFGENFDIHSGGKDLLFPHHENELAQSHCYHENTQWVNYWLHSGLLHLKDNAAKMSKSLQNTISINELLSKYTANQFRLCLMLSHYRNDVEFSDEFMTKAVRTQKKLSAIQSMAEAFIQGAGSSTSHVNGPLLLRSLVVTQREVMKHLANDFDTAQALRCLMNLVHVTNIELCKKSSKGVSQARGVESVAAIWNYLNSILSQLGLNMSTKQIKGSITEGSGQQMSQIIESTVAFREKVRNFALGGVAATSSDEEKARIKAHRKAHASLMKDCDQIRDELATLANVKIRDSKDGRTIWEVTEE